MDLQRKMGVPMSVSFNKLQNSQTNEDKLISNPNPQYIAFKIADSKSD